MKKGSSEETMQRSYMLRTERYFTGGTRNPANTPEVTSAMKYNVDNKDWHGMSTWMTAKSNPKLEPNRRAIHLLFQSW